MSRGILSAKGTFWYQNYFNFPYALCSDSADGKVRTSMSLCVRVTYIMHIQNKKKYSFVSEYHNTFISCNENILIFIGALHL